MLTATYTSKTAESKKVILLNNTLTFGDVLLGNITFLILLFLMRNSLCHCQHLYKLQFFYIYT